ncbi:MAG: hypothetical protein WBF17_26980 [Phycisphaerae bacterium]
MNRGRRRKTAILGDLRRLIAPLDVLYTIGNLIYRRSLRYTMLTAGIALIGMGANWLGLPGFTVKQAIMLPLLIGGLSLALGTFLKVVPSLIASRLLTVAQASDLNLMEDYRKSEVEEHLSALWDRLFKYECRLRMAAKASGGFNGGIRPGETENQALARAKGDFFRRANMALTSHLPQIRQMHLVGLDLRYLEDWRDGAYLDRSDAKLIEQFNGNTTLLRARAEAGMSGLAVAMLFNPRRLAQRLWFVSVTRMVAIQVASAVQRLNRKYNTDLFNAQALLWPGTEDDDWLDAFEGAREDVLQERRTGIRRIFGGDFETARDVLDHMLYCCFAMGTELRMRYDPDYCDGSLDYDVIDDLTKEGRNRRDLQRAKGFVKRARRDLEALASFIQTHRPKLLEPGSAEALRTARIAMHVDRDGLKRAIRERRGRAGAQSPQDVCRLIDDAVAQTAVYTRRLIAVRMHHELTRLSRKGYHKLVKALAYRDEGSRQ